MYGCVNVLAYVDFIIVNLFMVEDTTHSFTGLTPFCVKFYNHNYFSVILQVLEF
jgi:hypothetical protein